MSGTYVTDTGFQRKTLAEIVSELETIYKNQFGDDIDLGLESPFGQQIAISAQRESNLWELAQEIYTARNVDEATGFSLDYIFAEKGVQRIDGDPTQVDNVFLDGDAGTTIPANSRVRQPAGDIEYELVTGVTLDPLGNLASITYELDESVALPGKTYDLTINGSLYQYIAVGGEAAGTVWGNLFSQAGATNPDIPKSITGPNGIYATLETNELVFWAPFTATATTASVVTLAVLGNFEAIEEGPNLVPIGTLTEIVTPESGWLGVNNPLSGLPGRFPETDDEFRRRGISTDLTGKGTDENIRANLLTRVDGIADANVTSNRTNTVQNGLPPKSFEAVVSGSVVAQDVGDVIWDTIPAGIESFGNTQVIVTDSQGNFQEVYYTTPVEVFLHVRVNRAIYAEETYPSDGDNLIKEAIVDWAQGEYTLGKDVISTRIATPVYAVPGVGEVLIEIAVTPNPGDTPSWQTATIPVDSRSVASVITSRIVVEDL